ncbi:hypothetical protein RF11_04801 [Thelohanellus kitauei]|uniref:Uncharacterized protein n=1 Tax=Thelohanellus kitauei TaxID=669202 RepID=A0A0C2JTW5_THEKT|nr:hypothetical protein RF11_04801 [Thelohanellus kitauei]
MTANKVVELLISVGLEMTCPISYRSARECMSHREAMWENETTRLLVGMSLQVDRTNEHWMILCYTLDYSHFLVHGRNSSLASHKLATGRMLPVHGVKDNAGHSMSGLNSVAHGTFGRRFVDWSHRED